jgi:molybdenum cofactor cytidylyltransferase
MTELAAVILAAGAGSRLGGVAKALLPQAPGTFLSRIAATAREAGLAHGVVVVGPPFGDAVAEHARTLGLEVVNNPDPARGMASSVALGFAALARAARADDITGAWLWPVDHPHVRAATLAMLAAAADPRIAVQPRFAGRGGHPPLVGRALWPALAACGEAGARAVLAPHLTAIAVDDPGVLRDVDTPEDLAGACA